MIVGICSLYLLFSFQNTELVFSMKITSYGPQPPLALGRGHAHSPQSHLSGSMSNLEWRRPQMSFSYMLFREITDPRLHQKNQPKTSNKQSKNKPLHLWSAKLIQVHVSACLQFSVARQSALQGNGNRHWEKKRTKHLHTLALSARARSNASISSRMTSWEISLIHLESFGWIRYQCCSSIAPGMLTSCWSLLIPCSFILLMALSRKMRPGGGWNKRHPTHALSLSPLMAFSLRFSSSVKVVSVVSVLYNVAEKTLCSCWKNYAHGI